MSVFAKAFLGNISPSQRNFWKHYSTSLVSSFPLGRMLSWRKVILGAILQGVVSISMTSWVFGRANLSTYTIFSRLGVAEDASLERASALEFSPRRICMTDFFKVAHDLSLCPRYLFITFLASYSSFIWLTASLRRLKEVPSLLLHFLQCWVM